MGSKKSVVIVAAEETSVGAADEVMDSSVAEVVSEAMGIVDVVGVVLVEQAPVVAAVQTSPKLRRAFGIPYARTRDPWFSGVYAHNFSLLVLQHRRRMLQHCICVMMAG
jgi:hypothetical protein